MKFIFGLALLSAIFIACSDDSGDSTNCTDVADVTDVNTRGACTQTLAVAAAVNITESSGQRTITSNSIPNHMVGLFGSASGSLNPNPITAQTSSYTVTMSPASAGSITQLLSTSMGPQYSFGVLLNGVELDPEAAEPWPHAGPGNFSSANWEWNLDAMSINLGLDCNNAHVQPTGQYHYHGAPTLYLTALNAPIDAMTLIGYAADGFPIYYNYGYAIANDSNSVVVELQPSYRLKTGERPGDGSSAPCGPYTGIYTNDYEYVSGLGDLDECNGRSGVTPEYPGGTYYYVVTLDSYPYIPRGLLGTPSQDFRLQ